MLISHLTGIWIVNFKLKLFTAFVILGLEDWEQLALPGWIFAELCQQTALEGTWKTKGKKRHCFLSRPRAPSIHLFPE